MTGTRAIPNSTLTLCEDKYTIVWFDIIEFYVSFLEISITIQNDLEHYVRDSQQFIIQSL